MAGNSQLGIEQKFSCTGCKSFMNSVKATVVFSQWMST
uniref:Uncharacterized protein n=1 Tax=Anguilla anguilla TaxID=7936 RepID=A0A0E9XN01_ANGAN